MNILDLPKSVEFEYKGETDLYELVNTKGVCMSLTVSKDGKLFAMYCKDKHFRIFHFLTGKLYKVFNESLKFYVENYHDILKNENTRLEKSDFDKRLNTEKEIEKLIDKYLDIFPPLNIQFDETSHFIFYPSILGVKLIELHTNKLVKILGKTESQERFLSISLFQGKALRNNSGIIGTGGASSQGDKVMDPTLFTIAYKRNRFYMFTKREPAELETEKKLLKRDVMNEKSGKDDIQLYHTPSAVSLAKQAIIETSMGEIHIKLFPNECPKTIENFITHARNGYFNNLIFHRVIKGFMVQTGDPKGDGTGGESIWGGEFEDEINPNLKHDVPFTVSMANAGANTNGSQFFITTVPCFWLDGKHTVFGRVFRGMDTVQSIENVKVDFDDKPLVDVKLYTIKIVS